MVAWAFLLPGRSSNCQRRAARSHCCYASGVRGLLAPDLDHCVAGLLTHPFAIRRLLRGAQGPKT
jgi:hypothetical protein